jgi:acyl carrier protein
MGRMESMPAAHREPGGLGHLGWRERLEPRLRRVAADWLGVPEAWFRPDLSFGDDLAMSARDVTELAVALEHAAGVRVPGDAIVEAGTYGRLVDRIVEARADDRRPSLPRVFVRATLVPTRRDRCGVLLRSTWLSPYAIETLLADARRAGPGARLEVVVPAGVPLAVIEKVERAFAPLAASGVVVRVQHDRLPRGRAVA